MNTGNLRLLSVFAFTAEPVHLALYGEFAFLQYPPSNSTNFSTTERKTSTCQSCLHPQPRAQVQPQPAGPTLQSSDASAPPCLLRHFVYTHLRKPQTSCELSKLVLKTAAQNKKGRKTILGQTNAQKEANEALAALRPSSNLPVVTQHLFQLAYTGETLSEDAHAFLTQQKHCK